MDFSYSHQTITSAEREDPVLCSNIFGPPHTAHVTVTSLHEISCYNPECTFRLSATKASTVYVRLLYEILQFHLLNIKIQISCRNVKRTYKVLRTKLINSAETLTLQSIFLAHIMLHATNVYFDNEFHIILSI